MIKASLFPFLSRFTVTVGTLSAAIMDRRSKTTSSRLNDENRQKRAKSKLEVGRNKHACTNQSVNPVLPDLFSV